MFCVELWLPVMMCTFTSSRAPVIPTGAPIPSCSSTTKSCGSTCRISRPVGSDTAFAASIARRTSSRVISRFFPATAITPRLLNPLMCGPDRRQVHRVDLDPGHQLGLLDRLLDRVHRRLEVHHDAASDASRLRHTRARRCRYRLRRGPRRPRRSPSRYRRRGRPDTVLYAPLCLRSLTNAVRRRSRD